VHLWIEIAVRELTALAVLLAMGSGLASLLGKRFDAAARVAISPVLGFCLATCVFTTLIWFTAARNTFWLIPVIATLSVAVALRRSLPAGAEGFWHRARRLLARLSVRDALALALVCVVVAAPLSSTLHERDSVGPTGYLVLDTDGYTATADAMEQLSLREAIRPDASHANFLHKFLSMVARGPINIDASPLAANLELLMGLHATDTQSLFLIAFLVTGGLGAFAAVRYLTPRPGWVAPVAGMLFGGPLFLQLLADGSQAATCGLAVLMPLAVLGAECLREQRLANLAVLAVLASGLMALYPLWFPAVVAVGALVLATSAIFAHLQGRLSWQSLRRAAFSVAIALVLTILFDVLAFTRDVRYTLETLAGETLSGKPIYDLPLWVLPGWVLQTRQFYVLQSPPLFYLPNLSQAEVVEVLGAAVLPLLLIAVILFGLWRNRRGLLLVAFVVVFAALAEYGSAAHGCSYCVDRDTLPNAPTSVVLLMVGLGALATASHRWMRWSAIVLALATLIAVGAQTWTERALFAAQAYYLGGDEREAVSDLPPHAGPVALEGFGENGEIEGGVAELPLVYSLVYEHNNDEVSLPTEYDNNNSLAYFAGAHPDDPDFTPTYHYVLSRFGGVQTDRHVIAHAGPIALEERTGALDAILTTGVTVPMVRQEAVGQPSVVENLHMLVLGGGAAPAWVLLRMRTIAPATATSAPGLSSHASPHELVVCAPATGVAPMRRATVMLGGKLYPGPTYSEKWALSVPQGIKLVTMRAVSHCSV
jgi:hypothetical protein